MESDRRSNPLADGTNDRGYDLPSQPGSTSRHYAMLAYGLGGFTGLLLLVWKREDRFVQFHALQSIACTVAALCIAAVLWLFSFFPLLGFLYGMLLHLFQFLIFLLWLYLLWQAYSGRWFRIPYLGDWAEKQVL